ncbi:PQQ-binding-like beta-propeller repeat protein [Streptomyces peucetius]|uniref:PQQ-binding-like beta-propeller repeat protein n=1 Tax=Streptomyces peucetius TaxID=1950 RepID=A0ABY6I8L7_STRPE|nr:PQQ-binding-like beta-propeller repeat protein [Streptomyces peucetius]UYQ62580.1 PQQ-binding-like beta-propeller repeat protein [Streptomyces peucetius]
MGQPPRVPPWPQDRGAPHPTGRPPAAPQGRHPLPPTVPQQPADPPYPPLDQGVRGPGGGDAQGLLKGRTGIVVSAVTAAALVVGGGAWFALSDGDDGRKAGFAASSGATTDTTGGPGGESAEEDLNAQRKPGEAKVLFVTKNDTDLPGDGAYAFGPWVVGDTVVKAMYREVAGYSVTDGTKKWSVKLDSELCMAAPQHSPDGKIVVGVMDGYTEKSVCGDLRMIDARAGKAGWRKPVPEQPAPRGVSDFVLALSGSTVTVSGFDTSFGFGVSDGRQLFGKPASGCARFGFAGGSRLIAAAECVPQGDEVVGQELQEVDPATGAAGWTYRLEPDWKVDKVFSVDPVVLFAHKEDLEGTVTDRTVLALTDDGRLRSRIPFGEDTFETKCSSTGAIELLGDIQGWCAGAAADSSTAYLATEGTTTNEVVTFDLDTGKATGRSSPGPERTMLPMRAEDCTVVHHIGPSPYAGGAVSTIAPAGGERKVLLKLPKTDAEGFHQARAVYADGRLFLLAPLVNSLRDSEEHETNTMTAFGR